MTCSAMTRKATRGKNVPRSLSRHPAGPRRCGVTAISSLPAAALKQEWGAATEAKLNLAQRAISQFGGEGADDLLQTRLSDGSALGDNAAFIRMMAKSAEVLGEDAMEGDSTLRAASSQTPGAAQSELTNLYADTEFMGIYNDHSHPAHQEYHKRMDRLYELSAAGKGAR